MPIRFDKSVGKELLGEIWAAKWKTSWVYSRCLVVVHQRRMLNEGNLIAMQSKLSACSVNVIRRETSIVFVRMPVDNRMFTSQPTLPLWLSATRCEHSNNSDLTTGLNCLSAQRTWGNICRGRRARETNQSLFHTVIFQCIRSWFKKTPKQNIYLKE